MKSTDTHATLGARMSLLPASRPGKVEVAFQAAEASEVFIAGDFNQWNPRSTPLRKDANGTWRTALLLTPGPYEYRFVVDGRWQNDPRAICSIANPFGSRNSLLQVV